MFLKFQYRLQYRLLGKVKSLLFGLTVGCSMGGIRKPVGFQISADPKHQQKHIQLSAPARNHAVSVTPKKWRWQNDTKCVVFLSSHSHTSISSSSGTPVEFVPHESRLHGARKERSSEEPAAWFTVMSCYVIDRIDRLSMSSQYALDSSR